MGPAGGYSLQCPLKKGPKGLTDEFYGFKKSRKRSIFVIDSYLKDSAFKAVKRDVNCMRKGYLFREKLYKRVRVGPRGGVSPYKYLLSTPPFPPAPPPPSPGDGARAQEIEEGIF